MKITLIICSVDNTKFGRAAQAYQQLLASTELEIIRISDARSLAEGYNRGLARASGELILLSHDDVEFAAPNFWERVRKHMEHCDLLGVAGTRYYGGSQWGFIGPPYLAGQVANPMTAFGSKEPGYYVSMFGVTGPRMDGLQVLDGLFLAIRPVVFEKLRFDEALFDGFHGYDADFTYSAYLSGFRLAVATDLVPIHGSAGNCDRVYDMYLARLAEKHRATLPPLIIRPGRFAGVQVNSRAELLQVMLPDEFPLSLSPAKSPGLNITGFSRG